MNDFNKPVFAISIGDPNGIGPEITLKALSNNYDLYCLMTPVVFGDRNVLKFYQKKLSLKIEFEEIHKFSNLQFKSGSIYTFPIDINPYNPEFGKITPEGGNHAFQYINAAISEALKGNINGVVTAPINKEALRIGKVPYLDHTAMFSKLTKSRHAMTLFVSGTLRTFFYSRHIPFNQISESLEIPKIVETLDICVNHLQKMGINNPHIAVAALNPHGGEMGMFGKEEIEILIPAVEQAQKMNLKISGPIPADSVYHLAKDGNFDAVLSLYHDQGHIATKTLDFHKTVSITTGLPFLRTSVDHGTAMDIAGKGIADETSMVEAIKAALKYYW